MLQVLILQIVLPLLLLVPNQKKRTIRNRKLRLRTSPVSLLNARDNRPLNASDSLDALAAREMTAPASCSSNLFLRAFAPNRIVFQRPFSYFERVKQVNRTHAQSAPASIPAMADQGLHRARSTLTTAAELDIKSQMRIWHILFAAEVVRGTLKPGLALAGKQQRRPVLMTSDLAATFFFWEKFVA